MVQLSLALGRDVSTSGSPLRLADAVLKHETVEPGILRVKANPGAGRRPRPDTSPPRTIGIPLLGSAGSTRLLPGLHHRNLDQSCLIGLLRRRARPFPELLFEAHRVGDNARRVVGECH